MASETLDERIARLAVAALGGNRRYADQVVSEVVARLVSDVLIADDRFVFAGGMWELSDVRGERQAAAEGTTPKPKAKIHAPARRGKAA